VYKLHATCAISFAITCNHEKAVKTKNLYDSYSKDKYYQNSEYKGQNTPEAKVSAF
jgi:hypothetical protein